MVEPGMLLAGAARRTINPPLGTRQTGFRLFGNPVQAIETWLAEGQTLVKAGCVVAGLTGGNPSFVPPGAIAYSYDVGAGPRAVESRTGVLRRTESSKTRARSRS